MLRFWDCIGHQLLRTMRAYAEVGAGLLRADLRMDATRTQPAAAPLMPGKFLMICQNLFRHNQNITPTPERPRPATRIRKRRQR